MIDSLSIAGFPRVVRLMIDQKSGADAGLIVADCVMNPGTVDNLPVSTTLTVRGRNFNGTWKIYTKEGPNEVPGCPGLARFIFRDARELFTQFTMPKSFNRRNASGEIESNSKSIKDLWKEIKDLTGVDISVGTVPDFEPPANWEKRIAKGCVEELLAMTGCRLVYDPITAKFNVNLADAGTMPSIAQRLFKPISAPRFSQLIVQSAPTLYEGLIKVKSSWLNESGDLEDLPDPIEYFLGYPDEADAERRNRLVQSGYRIWKPLRVNHPSNLTWPDNVYLLGHRVVALTGSTGNPISQDLEIKNESSHWSISGDGSALNIQYRRDAGVITSDVPMLVVDNEGELQDEIDLIGAYYVKDLNEYGGWKVKKNTASIATPVGGNTLKKHLVVNLVRPVDSDMIDGPSDTGWQDLIDDIANANLPLMSGVASEVMLPNLIRTGGCGRIARASWFIRLNHVPELRTTFVMDEPPPAIVQHIGEQAW